MKDTRGIDKVRACIDHNNCVWSTYSDRGWFTTNIDYSGCHWVRRVGDIDKLESTSGTVGVEELHSILRRDNNLGSSLSIGVARWINLLADGKVGDTLKELATIGLACKVMVEVVCV
jgi:hypothetical protein